MSSCTTGSCLPPVGGESPTTTEVSRCELYFVDEASRGSVHAKEYLELVATPRAAEVAVFEGSENVTETPPLEVGDLVVLGGAPAEFRPPDRDEMSLAGNCEDNLDRLLDDRTGIGECWPNFFDVDLVSTAWRLGRRVVVGGQVGRSTRQFNDLIGTIVAHPREGHPTFVSEPSAPNNPRLALCVRFDDAMRAGIPNQL